MQRDAYYGEWLDHPSRSGFVASIDVMLGAAFARRISFSSCPKLLAGNYARPGGHPSATQRKVRP